MRQASAYAPGHVTGFFQICDTAEDLLQRGSRGCGASVTQGVKTSVAVSPADANSHIIRINGEITNQAIVSLNVLDKILALANQPYEINIEHTVSTPLGAGFGSSGGGAISLALALNEALGIGLSFTEAAQVAHISELECKTGLGTVFAAVDGGFGVLVKAGAPGVGRGVFYDHPEDLSLVYLYFGPMETSKALSDPVVRERINSLGGRYVDRIKDDLRPELFMELSRRFTDTVNIKTPRLSRVLEAAEEASVPCAMAMFGEVAFSLVYREKAAEVKAFYQRIAKGSDVQIVDVDGNGARLI